VVVEPPDPLERRELNILESGPRAPTLDQFCPIEPDDRLGQSVVVAVATDSHRRLDAGQSQVLRVVPDVVLGEPGLRCSFRESEVFVLLLPRGGI